MKTIPVSAPFLLSVFHVDADLQLLELCQVEIPRLYNEHHLVSHDRIMCRVDRFLFGTKKYQIGKIFQNGHKNIPNGRKIHQMAIKYTHWPTNIQTIFIATPSKIYPNWELLATLRVSF
jgi:hypothetical protein